MKKHVRLKGTVCFSVCNGSFLLKERPIGLQRETKCFSTVCKGSENQLTIK